MLQDHKSTSTRACAWLAVCAVFVMLSGCVAQGKKFFPIQGIAGESIVYVYRESGLIGHGLDLQIFANRVSVGTLQVGTYAATNMRPGLYEWTAEPHKTGSVVMSGIEQSGLHGNILLSIELVQGQTYFLKLEEGLGTLLIEPVPSAEGEAALGKLHAPK
jgi:hypothetical protein